MAKISFDLVIDTEVKSIAMKHGLTNFHYNVKGDEFTGVNYTSKIVHVQINEDGNQKRRINLLLKLALNNTEDGRKSFASEKMFQTELHAYQFIFPEITKFEEENSIPEKNRFKYMTFYNGVLDFLKEYVVMEDLSAIGFKPCDKKKTLDFEECTTMLCALANYHAASFAMRAKDPSRFAKLRENVATQSNIPILVYSVLKDQSDKVLPFLKSKTQRKAIENFVERRCELFQEILNSTLSEPYNVICHGDCSKNNVMFRRQDNKLDVMLLDYQELRYSSPATDIVLNFYTSTPKSFRDKHMAELCDKYYKTLEENLKCYGCNIMELYPRDVFEKQIIDSAPIGISFGLMGCCLLHGKSGEEKDLDALINNMSDIQFTPTEAMVKGLEDFADDIIKGNHF